ncbi:putative membrane protein YeaQ/YmgE (transglycosylase-associated protein family) [Neisseria sp. HSC-16F19]|nr:GlsB/YeaQ/YmgE family stress response membrane protein [Neisseria sp. HSC-16F19]MCP2041015.1 putative membrane protein YeaQ/YmgE (transglycosylase-associated protein family) [Neisseria sp. HSC-16F19]
MGFIWTILVGFVVGVLAKFIHPGKENMGFILTTLLGIGGAMLAGYVGQAMGWYAAGEGAGFIASVIGAFVILFVYGKLSKKS